MPIGFCNILGIKKIKHEIIKIFPPLTITYIPGSLKSWALSSVFFNGVRGRSLPGAGGASRADLKFKKKIIEKLIIKIWFLKSEVAIASLLHTSNQAEEKNSY